MDSIMNFFQTYEEIWKIGLAVVSAVVIFVLLAGILRQIKKLNANLKSITTNMQAYFDVILTEEEEQDSEKNPEVFAKEDEKQEELQADIETLKKQEEEEKLFNAVLQEYFS